MRGKSDMKLHRVIAIIALINLVGGCAVENRSGGASSRVEKGAVTGQDQMLSYWYSITIDCSSRGYPVIRTLVPPSHGTLRTDKGEDFPNFADSNPRHVCNRRKRPVTYIYYRSEPNFTDTDTTTVEVLFPDGNIRTVTYAIKVRP